MKRAICLGDSSKDYSICKHKKKLVSSLRVSALSDMVKYNTSDPFSLQTKQIFQQGHEEVIHNHKVEFLQLSIIQSHDEKNISNLSYLDVYLH